MKDAAIARLIRDALIIVILMRFTIPWRYAVKRGKTHYSLLVRFDHVASFIVNPDDAAVTIIEIRPFRNGWKCFEAPGVEPVFLNQEDAIDYATGRACFRSGEIRILQFKRRGHAHHSV